MFPEGVIATLAMAAGFGLLQWTRLSPEIPAYYEWAGSG
jgi:hypothetical protein